MEHKWIGPEYRYVAVVGPLTTRGVDGLCIIREEGHGDCRIEGLVR